MLLAAYLDESGTHDTSPISIMAGYLGTAEQWRAFDADWMAFVRSVGVNVHAVDLFKRTRAFKGWPAERVNAFAMQLDGVIARHLQLDFSVIVRDDDYRAIYANGPKPRRSRLDSKYGVCFRACLALVANVYPRQPVSQSGPMVFRIPISQDVLRSLKEGVFASATAAAAAPA
jgi:hypothetical protein